MDLMLWKGKLNAMSRLILTKIDNAHNTSIWVWIEKDKVSILLREIFFKWHLNILYANIVVGYLDLKYAMDLIL